MSSAESPTKITHVIFDFDGVLIDSERQYSLANSRCLEPYGRKFTSEMKCAQMGRKKRDAVTTLLAMNDLIDKVDVDEYLTKYDELLDELIPISPILPGATELIHHFNAHEIPLAICTGSDSVEFEMKSRKHADWLAKVPLRVLSGSDPDITHGKPHPEPYLVTMRRFAIQPSSPKSVLVFEDSINGARSAIAAGMTVIMVPQEEFLPSNWTQVRSDLEPQLAEIISSLVEFQPVKYGLPHLNF